MEAGARLISRVLAVGVTVLGLVAGVMATGASSDVEPHRFTGVCHITGVAEASYTSAGFTFEGAGICTGQLDGEQVTDAPVTTSAWGTGLSFVGGWSNGFGDLVFEASDVTFPIGFQVFAPGPIRFYPSCYGCSGVAFGVVDPVAPTQPGPGPSGPRTAIQIVAATAREFVA